MSAKSTGALPAILITSLFLAPALPAQEKTTEGPFTDLVRASKLLGRAKHKEAETLLRRVVEAIPKHAEAWHQLALARDLQGKKKLALSAVKRAVSLDMKHVRAHLLASRLVMKTDRLHAGELAERAAKYAGGEPRHMRRAARLLMEAGQPEDAAPIVKKLSAEYPKDQDLLYLRAELALSLGKQEDAIPAYKQLMKLRPFDPWPAESLANIQLLMGKKDDAIDSLRRSLKIRPSNNSARTKLIEILTELKADPKEVAAHKTYLRFYKHVQKNRTGKTPGKTPGKAPSKTGPKAKKTKPAGPWK